MHHKHWPKNKKMCSQIQRPRSQKCDSVRREKSQEDDGNKCCPFFATKPAKMATTASHTNLWRQGPKGSAPDTKMTPKNGDKSLTKTIVRRCPRTLNDPFRLKTGRNFKSKRAKCSPFNTISNRLPLTREIHCSERRLGFQTAESKVALKEVDANTNQLLAHDATTVNKHLLTLQTCYILR